MMEELTAAGRPMEPVSTLTAYQVYSAMEQTSLWEVRPPEIHFAGFELGSVHRRTLRIINKSASSQRLHVVAPETGFFHCVHHKRGLVPPGLAEEVTLEFRPLEWRYHRDRVRLHCPGGNLVVPLHAYPVLAQRLFPPRIDFGTRAVAECCERVVRLESRVPVAFEFRVRKLDPAPEVAVFPTQGVVPPNGIAEVVVAFQPLRLVTTCARLELRVEQFGAEPVICVVSGAGGAGAARAVLLAHALAEDGWLASPAADSCALESASLAVGLPAVARALTRLPEQEGGGAGGGDAFTRRRAQLHREKTARSHQGMELRLPVWRDPSPAACVGGTLVPPNLTSHGAISYVLQQRPDRVRVRDLHESGRAAGGRCESPTLHAQALPPGLSLLDDPSASPQLQELAFSRELARHEEAEKQKELTLSEALGGDLMAPEDVQVVLAARAVAQGAAGEGRLAAESHEDSLRPTFPVARPGVSLLAPAWSPYHADAWRIRAAVVDQIVRAVRKVIYRLRASKRLQRIHAVITAAGGTAERVAELVASRAFADWGEAAAAGAREPPPAFATPWRVVHHPLPPQPPARTLQPETRTLPLGPVAAFQLLEPLPLAEPSRWLRMGYSREAVAALAPEVPLLDAQKSLLAGAEEESCTLAAAWPSSSAQAGEGGGGKWPLPPRLLGGPLSAAAAPQDLGDTALSPLPPSWGMDLAALLRPAALPFHNSLTAEPLGSASCHATTGRATLSDVHLPRADTWAALESLPPMARLLGGAGGAAEGPSGQSGPPIVRQKRGASKQGGRGQGQVLQVLRENQARGAPWGKPMPVLPLGGKKDVLKSSSSSSSNTNTNTNTNTNSSSLSTSGSPGAADRRKSALGGPTRPPPRAVWLSPGTPLPHLMSGPVEEDQMSSSDSDEDEETEAENAHPSSSGTLGMGHGAPNRARPAPARGSKRRGLAGTPNPASLTPAWIAQHFYVPGQAGASGGGSEVASPVSSARSAEGCPPLLCLALPREQQQAGLEAAEVAQREEAVQRIQRSIQQMNALIKRPLLRIPELV